MNESLPLTYTEAVIAVAGRDPALAALLMHHHDCLESAKSENVNMSKAIAVLTKRFDGFTVLAWTTMATACGTLIGGLCFIAWQVLSHPHGFALVMRH